MKKFSAARFKSVLFGAFRQGLTPHKLAVTCATGIVFGIFPVFGTTTFICFALAILFRLNMPVIQLVNYLVAPLQILFTIPFIKLGTLLFNLNPFPYDGDQLVELFKSDFIFLLKEVGIALLLGIGMWAILAVPLYFFFYYLFLFLFKKWLTTPDQREL
jgi:uncharacterized protein (DUF2062 family)